MITCFSSQDRLKPKLLMIRASQDLTPLQFYFCYLLTHLYLWLSLWSPLPMPSPGCKSLSHPCLIDLPPKGSGPTATLITEHAVSQSAKTKHLEDQAWVSVPAPAPWERASPEGLLWVRARLGVQPGPGKPPRNVYCVKFSVHKPISMKSKASR